MAYRIADKVAQVMIYGGAVVALLASIKIVYTV